MDKRSIQLVVKDVSMITLALLSVFLLFSEVIFNLTIEQVIYIQYIDLAIALIFLGEFIYHVWKASDRDQFLRRYWWELFACIPITNYTTQLLRALKLIRLFPVLETFRFLRFVVRLKMLVELSRKTTKQAFLVYMLTIVGALMLLGALGFYYFEKDFNPNVHGYWDSVWWAIVTLTTIGYGDIYPVTTGGRIVAIFLMLTGVGSLGVFIATVNAFIFKQKPTL